MQQLKLGIRYQEIPYHLIWLNPDPQKKELYIQFIQNFNIRKNKIPVYKNGNVLFEEGMWDHLSFHSDGTVHIRTKFKRKGKKDYIHKQHITHSIYDFKPHECVPILALTYNILHNENCFKIMKSADLVKNSHLWEIDKPMLFTMLIFMANIHNYERFYSEYINQKLGIRSEPLMVDMGDHFHCLMIILTAKVPQEFQNGYLSKQANLIKNQVDSLPFIGQGILPPHDYLKNGLINQKKCEQNKSPDQKPAPRISGRCS